MRFESLSGLDFRALDVTFSGARRLGVSSDTPDCQSDSEHFYEESRDYLPSSSRENQSEDDSESTDDGFGRFTDHQVHLSTSRQWLCLSCTTFGFVFVCFFSPID